MSVLICWTCVADAASAEHLAERLIAEQLAACVNIVPGVRSIYRWQGQIERGTEQMLMIKTTRAAFERLSARLKALHPYELPELIAVESSLGDAAYLAWVEAAVADPSAR